MPGNYSLLANIRRLVEGRFTSAVNWKLDKNITYIQYNANLSGTVLHHKRKWRLVKALK